MLLHPRWRPVFIAYVLSYLGLVMFLLQKLMPCRRCFAAKGFSCCHSIVSNLLLDGIQFEGLTVKLCYDF